MGGWGVHQLNWQKVGQINGGNTYLNGSCYAVRVPGTRQKYHCLRHKKIFYG